MAKCNLNYKKFCRIKKKLNQTFLEAIYIDISLTAMFFLLIFLLSAHNRHSLSFYNILV